MKARETDRPGTRLEASPLRRRLAVGIGCVLGLTVGLELSLRAAGALWPTGKPGTRVDASSGDRPFTILCIGDSWTQGATYGRYPEFLVRRLSARREGVRFHQVNLGRAGTNSSQSLLRLSGELATHVPDLLLVLTGNNDHHNLTDSTYWRFHDEALDGRDLLAARMRVFAHSLRVFRLGRTLSQQAASGATPNEFFEAGEGRAERAGLVAIDMETHRRQLEYNLTRFVELAHRERVPIVLQTYFHFHGYRVNDIIRDVASRHGVPLVDHNLLFHTAIPVRQRQGYRIADGHPNARGYALMADNGVAALEEQGLIP
jgi:lysophospholipase L1-like esterase